MIEDTIARLEATIKKIGAASFGKKAELLRLLATLRREVEQLSKTHAEQARSIAGFTEVAAHESLRRDKSPELRELSVTGLSLSVRGFEASHPELVESVNEICSLLSSIGI
ncbi:MAG: DUF4404 family protein [Elusimicrobiota bacterium]